MRFVDMFCGMGTIRMGFEQAGHECVYSVEFDKHKREIYKVIFGSEPDAGDITTVRASDIPRSDCWCFGAPCQDYAEFGITKISVLPDYAQDLTESEAAWYERCLDLCGKKNPQIDPNGFSTKMLKVCCQAITDGTLPQFKLKWGNAGTMCNGNYSTQKISESHKTGNGCTLSSGPSGAGTGGEEMKAHIIEEKKVLVHGGMKYRCESCGKSWFMSLEIGVEDFGKHGRPHQPAPFMIQCDCGEFAHDISGYIPLPDVRPLFPGMRYFAYDNSGQTDACGKPSIYQPNCQQEANHE